MKNKMKRIFMLLVTILFVSSSGIVDLEAEAAEEKQYIPLNQEVEVDYGKTYYFILPSAGKISMEGDSSYVMQNNEYLCYISSSDIARLPAGEYYLGNIEDKVRINFITESSSNYEQEFNDTLDTANTITLNNLYYGNSNYSGYNYDIYSEKDYFKFNIASVGSLYIDTILPIDVRAKIVLYKEDENLNVTELISDEIREIDSGDKNEVYSRKLRVSPGTYYVMIQAEKGKDYQFKVVYNQETSDSYETEDNNTQDIANVMLPNTGYTGNIQSSEDVDYYKMTLSSQGKAKLRLQTPRQTTNKLFKAELMEVNESGQLQTIETIYSSENPVVFGNEKILKAGDYYIKVQNGLDGYYNSYKDEHTHTDYIIQCSYDEMKLVETIEILCDEEELKTGDTTTLTAEIMPTDAQNKQLQWSSADESVVKVNQNGTITCVAPGQAIITAKATDGSNVYGEIQIVVSKRMVEEITVNLPNDIIVVGKTMQAKAVISPKNADNTSIIWESSNPKVAEISMEGKITALKAGKTSIKAIAEDGSGIVGTATLTVEKKQSSDATLKSLSATTGKWNKSFTATRTSYTLTLTKNTKSVKLTPKANDKKATIKINGKTAKSITVKLAAGKSKTIKFKVTAENGKTKTYTVKVVKKK